VTSRGVDLKKECVSCFLLAAILWFALQAPPANGQAIGLEFQINTYTTKGQDVASVALDSEGAFVVVWQGNSFVDYTIFSQRFDSMGAVLGADFRVNTYTPNGQINPAIACDAGGNFVVVWTSNLQDGSTHGIFGQRYSSDGGPLGAEFQVNTYTTGSQYFSKVASDASGNFVVVWQGDFEDGHTTGVFGQRFASSGLPLGPEFRANTYTTGRQGPPSIAIDASGDFVVVWKSSYPQDEVFAQRYASMGEPLGGEFRVNTYTTMSQSYPSVASDSAGNFVVVWHSYNQDGALEGVFGQRYESGGSPLGAEFRVNSYTTDRQSHPAVASDASGSFMVVWRSSAQDGSAYGVFGQVYASTGALLGGEFRVNTYTSGNQISGSVAAGPEGHFVVVWSGFSEDGSYDGVFGQRFCAIPPSVMPPSALTTTQTTCQ